MMKSPIDQSQSSTINKTINDNTEENIFPTTIQCSSSDDSLISNITLPSFKKRKTIINKVDQFLKRFKLKKRKSSKSQNQIQTTETTNEKLNNSRVNKIRTRFSSSKESTTDDNNIQNEVDSSLLKTFPTVFLLSTSHEVLFTLELFSFSFVVSVVCI